MITSAQKERVRKLYYTLSEIESEHDDVTDTDVREALHEVVTFGFVWGRRLPASLRTLRMLSREGDARVISAVVSFLRDADGLFAGVRFGQERLDVLQDRDIYPEYDLFFGHTDEPLGHTDEPLIAEELSKDLFEEPEYEE